MYGRCIKPLNPMLILIGLNKEEAKNVALRRGCDVIVSTPDSVLRLLAHHSLLFLRICHLVFDEVDRLFSEANDQERRPCKGEGATELFSIHFNLLIEFFVV
ncbi:hypothetical protein NDU88_003022 [Pleurodeles waltl]|uniref:RNA helicase n=1 Tax=Pleurodeles waltl TaxID=8319 RepID=A0AAV7L2W6_PLEWA|nr:hypothetical protein NDU88_003022 [Pleurodeles waltl]